MCQLIFLLSSLVQSTYYRWLQLVLYMGCPFCCYIFCYKKSQQLHDITRLSCKATATFQPILLLYTLYKLYQKLLAQFSLYCTEYPSWAFYSTKICDVIFDCLTKLSFLKKMRQISYLYQVKRQTNFCRNYLFFEQSSFSIDHIAKLFV